jgi:hypothetical protein
MEGGGTGGDYWEGESEEGGGEGKVEGCRITAFLCHTCFSTPTTPPSATHVYDLHQALTFAAIASRFPIQRLVGG